MPVSVQEAGVVASSVKEAGPLPCFVQEARTAQNSVEGRPVVEAGLGMVEGGGLGMVEGGSLGKVQVVGEKVVVTRPPVASPVRDDLVSGGGWDVAELLLRGPGTAPSLQTVPLSRGLR